MITIFAVPKAFKGHFGVIQENAIVSWTKINPRPEIILFGNEEGTTNICKKFKLEQVRNIKKNKHGTPILSDVFRKAKKEAKNEILMYVNCDIILLGNLREAINKIGMKKFFITGRRWDLDIKKNITFKVDWAIHLRKKIKKTTKLHQMGALDYFIFPKSVNLNPPPFAIGRGVWDNWLLYRAKFLKIAVIDATYAITAIHQNHDYSHGGGKEKVWNGLEWKNNQQLAKGKKRPFNLYNSDYELSGRRLIRPEASLFRLWRNVQIQPVINPQTSFFTWPIVLCVEFFIKIYRKLSFPNL